MDSVVLAPGLQNTDSVVTGPPAYLLCSLWDLPGLGIEPKSPCITRWILNHWTTREALFFPLGDDNVLLQVPSSPGRVRRGPGCPVHCAHCHALVSGEGGFAGSPHPAPHQALCISRHLATGQHPLVLRWTDARVFIVSPVIKAAHHQSERSEVFWPFGVQIKAV